MITTDEASKELWNQSYKLEAADTLWGEQAVPWVSMAAKHFTDDKATKVLDLPCGDGRNALNLARSIPFVVAADASANALAIAKRRVGAGKVGNVLLQLEDLFATSFLDAQFDGVFCCDVLGHIVRVTKALSELVRVCRPGGLVIGNFFALEDTTRGKEMERISGEQYRYQDKFYFHFRSRAEVAGILAQIPVEVMAIELARWTEPPHEAYREYSHEHASWVFTVRKRANAK